MSLNDFHDLFVRLSSNVGQSADCRLSDLKGAIDTTFRAVSRILVEYPDLLPNDGARSSGIPPALRRLPDQARVALRRVLHDSPPNSFVAAGISPDNKILLYWTMIGALDALEELFDSNDPARKLADMEYWFAWARMETRFAMDDARELLQSIAYSTAPVQSGYPYRPIVSPNGIRLLVVHPDDDPESDIRCALIHETDYSNRAYAALSYVWGDLKAPRVDIIVNSVRYPVTSNLFQALKHFRHQTRRRVLWVDAICINQDDIAEKNHQVSNMAHIYRSAAYILMWVGEASDDSQYAIQWLREVQRGGRAGLAYSCSNDTIRNHWPAIRAFFQRPYWRRVWILQEAISRDDSLVCCGVYAITWSVLCKMVLHWLPDMKIAIAFPDESRNNVHRLPNKGAICLQLVESFGYLRHHADFTEKRRQNVPISFLSGLIASRSCSASDLHDYIYAIAGFVSNFAVEISYGTSVYRVYIDTTRNVIEETGRLDILTVCKEWTPDRPERQLATIKANEDAVANLMRNILTPRSDLEILTLSDLMLVLSVVRTAYRELGRRDDSFEMTISHLEALRVICLPSWVPRWHWEVREPYLLLNQSNPHHFNASRGTAAQYEFGRRDYEITLRGIKIDVVRSVRTFPETELGVLKHAWEFWGQESSRSLRYPTLESQKDAFFSTCMRGDKTNNQRYQAGDKLFEYKRMMFDVQMDWATMSESIQASTNMNIEPDIIMKGSIEWTEEYPSIIEAQAFLVCENGYIGLGPFAAMSGDIICVLNGGDVPFLLRPALRGCYYLMGEAYIHGIMNGEAIDLVQNGRASYANFTII